PPFMAGYMLQIRNQRLGDRPRVAVAAEVARQADARLQSVAYRLLNALGTDALADVFEHHRRGTQQGDRVGHPLAGDIRGTAVNRFEDGVALADVRAGHDTQAAD